MEGKDLSLKTIGAIRYYTSDRIHPVDYNKDVKLLKEYLVPELSCNPEASVVFWHSSSEVLTLDILVEMFDLFCKDDVFTPVFTTNVYLVFNTLDHPVDDLVWDLMSSWKTRRVFALDYSLGIAPGPYFRGLRGFHDAWRIYEDTQGAFSTAVLSPQDPDAPFSEILTCGIPVPSRLYYLQKCHKKPLAGLRVAVKDILDLKGIVTSAGSRDYARFHSRAQLTAPCIKDLLEAGAVIIGKTKTLQFASAQPPTSWVDFHCPFNPRGDGYQDPDFSSTGSAAAIAAYDWLDMAVGSDTLTSITGPAAEQGIFGLRPTWTGNVKGCFPVSGQLDTIGFFSRDVEMASKVTKAWIDTREHNNLELKNAELLVPIDLLQFKTNFFSEAAENFIKEYEALSGRSRSTCNLENMWDQYQKNTRESLSESFRNTIAHIQLHDHYHNITQFRAQFRERFGISAYEEPVLSYKRKLGQAISEDDYLKATVEKSAFMQFVEEAVLPQRKGVQTIPILVLPVGEEYPLYRDRFMGAPEQIAASYQGFGFAAFSIAPLAGVPAFVLPIGHYPYISKVTNTTEFKPICIMVLGPRGSDVLLLEIVKTILKKSTRLCEIVSSGKYAFPI